MAVAVYILCAGTATVCAWLLGRAFAGSRTRLLLWSCLCFVGLALNNVLLFLDKVVIHDVSLADWRSVPAAAGLAALIYGLVWDGD